MPPLMMNLVMPVSLMGRLAIRLSPQAGKSLVIPQAGEGDKDSLRDSC